MSRLILLAVLALTLSGCSTISVNNCAPPDFAMVQAAPLAPLPDAGMSMQEAVEQWQKDTGLYRDLADKHDVLVGWVSEKC